ncbi:Separin [Golovinomyces cichoracearum]|uniref:separase n=1 Tax=Golovinomyces cichoracearum TaxID=62708 RepID=A0A420HLC8_9PEZI|nr:Separin [Golovinomyces cichoracearum]
MESLDEKVQLVHSEFGNFTSATAITLTELLFAKNLPKSTKSTKSTGTTKANPGACLGKSKAKKLTSISKSNENQRILSCKEKSILATEVINATLKSLNEAVKSSGSARNLREKPKDTVLLSERDGRRKSSCISESPSQPKLSTRKTSHSNISGREYRMCTSVSFNNNEYLPTAECARIAFACLRTLQFSQVSDINLPPLQLENGMSVLIAKLISLEMDDLATKELRILKRCLLSDGTTKKIPIVDETSVVTSGNTLADLLDFGKVTFTGPKLEIVITTQLQVLRLINSSSKKSKYAHLALQVLSTEYLTSPTNLIMTAAKDVTETEKKEKIIRQLYSLSEYILSLCPSILSSYDIVAAETKLNVCPEDAILLQTIALRSRFLWWGLSGRKGDLIKDIFDPFFRCFSTFVRRSKNSTSETYSIAVEVVEVMRRLLEGHSISYSSTLNLLLVEIYKVLASLAKHASQIDAAIDWANQAHHILKTEKASEAKLYSAFTRIISLRLQSPTRETVEEEQLMNLLEYLGRPFSGEVSEIDDLLIEVSHARRAALNLLNENFKQTEVNSKISRKLNDSSQEMYRSLVFMCPLLSLRYLGSAPDHKSTHKQVTRYDKKLQFIRKISIYAIDSTLFLVKTLLNQGQMKWEILDSKLQDCLSLLNRLDGGSEDVSWDTANPIPTTSYRVRISNLYYTQYLKNRENQAHSKNNEIIRVLRRSVDCIRDRPFGERKMALFTVKLERLAELYKNNGKYDEVLNLLCTLRNNMIEEGTLSTVIKKAETKPLKAAWCETPDVAMLGRTIHSILKVQLKIKASATQISLVEDNWSQEERAIILEYELEYLCKQSTQNSKLTAELTRVVVGHLLEIYQKSKYPLRRFRVLLRLLLNDYSNLCEELKGTEFELDYDFIENLVIKDTEDEGLSNYYLHYKNMVMMSKELDKEQPSLKKLTKGLSTWLSIISSCQNHFDLSGKIDDIIELLAFLHTINDWFQVHGHDNIRVAALQLILLLNEKCEAIIKPDELTLSFVVLGMQWLHLGYSGKASLYLDRARTSNKKTGGSSFVSLQLQIFLCEYLLTIGNLSEVENNLSLAQSLFVKQKGNLFYSSTAISLHQKTKTNILISNAHVLSSKLALERGLVQTALGHAKQSVQLLRRTWNTIEENMNHKANIVDNNSRSDLNEITKEFSNMSLKNLSQSSSSSSGTSHDYTLFWTIITPLFHSLKHLSSIFGHHGMFQETVYYADQAYKLAKQVKSDIHLAISGTDLGNIWLRGGNLSKGSELLNEAKSILPSSEKSKLAALLSFNLGMMHGLQGDNDVELSLYNDAIIILNSIIRKEHILSIEILLEANDITEDQVPLKKGTNQKKTLTKKTIIRNKPATRSNLAINPKSRVESNSSLAIEYPHLLALRSLIIREKARVLVLQKRLADASKLLIEAETTFSSLDKVSHGLAIGRNLLVQSLNQMDADPVYSILQDSTISFPSILGASKTVRNGENQPVSLTSPRKVITTRSSGERSHLKNSSDNFFDKLRRALDYLRDTLSTALIVSPTALIYKISHLLNSVALLLSTAGQAKGKSITHPGLSSLFVETARNLAHRRERRAIQADPQIKLKVDGCNWPQINLLDSSKASFALQDDHMMRFEREYIDIIPKSWVVVSISLSESRHELSLIRLMADNSPFILRLPFGRTFSIDAHEENFGYDQGRAELQEIIELANKTAHDAGSRLGREARLSWWEVREGLDARMKGLLENIEKVWLGGFKGIFSQNFRRPDLLMRFQKSLQEILDKYLPSRQKRNKRNSPSRVNLDSRIFELFIGLGDPSDKACDFSELLIDLLYFVVDVLQFHGELNAYAEIDFDMIVLETTDALRCYHEANRTTSQGNEDRHIILVLDKALHCFPWESLPCLDGIAVSRLPSLEFLRERMMNIQSENSSHDKPSGCYIDRNQGSYILNPGGDLKHTLGVFQESLQGLRGWNGVVNREPSEEEFKKSLLENDVFLYFGHGSGAQYIRAREIQNLPKCAVSVLMGCSSGALTETGEFEPYGPPINYLHAGSNALVATLWDVTDKDIDRFAKSTFEHWGLFRPYIKDNELTVSPSRKKGKNNVIFDQDVKEIPKISLVEAVTMGRKACHLRYLNAAAVCVYGIPVYLKN